MNNQHEYRSLAVWAAAIAMLGLAGCSPQQQSNATKTAEKSLNTVGNVASKALDQGSQSAANVALTGTIKGKFAATKGLPYDDITVSTNKGTVTLGGSVKTAHQKNLAGSLAVATPGVDKVINHIKVG